MPPLEDARVIVGVIEPPRFDDVAVVGDVVPVGVPLLLLAGDGNVVEELVFDDVRELLLPVVDEPGGL